MIDAITGKDLTRLAGSSGPQHVSLYLTTHRMGADAQQDPIRLKNLLKQARTELSALGCRSNEIELQLAPFSELTPGHPFWKNVEEGLALFSSPGASDIYRLAVAVPDLAVVADRYHLKPLLPAVSSGEIYYLLAISQNVVRLFRGNSAGVSAMEDAPIPGSMAEALSNDDRERQLTSHSAGRVASGRVTASFHGQGDHNDTHRDDLKRFFRMVDDGVRVATDSFPAPIVLAGVAEDQSAYRSVTRSKWLVDTGVTGNQDRTAPADLHVGAWPIVSDLFDRNRHEATELIRSHPERMLDQIQPVLSAAAGGRVEAVFVPVGLHRWAEVAEGGGTSEVHDVRAAGDTDLLDLIAFETLSNGGSVYAVEPSQIPGEGELAAILRY